MFRPMEQPLIRCEALSFAYPKGAELLHNAHLSLMAGSFSLISGVSGGGKSSFLRLLVALEKPCSGTIYLKEKPLQNYKVTQLRQHIALLGQSPSLMPGTIRENLLLPFQFQVHAGQPKPHDTVLKSWLERLGLDALSLDSPANTLSVGQSQRLCLIRILLPGPSVLLLDEPTSALDTESSDQVHALTEELSTQHALSIVQVDHSAYVPACAHTRYRLEQGSINSIA